MKIIGLKIDDFFIVIPSRARERREVYTGQVAGRKFLATYGETQTVAGSFDCVMQVASDSHPLRSG